MTTKFVIIVHPAPRLTGDSDIQTYLTEAESVEDAVASVGIGLGVSRADIYPIDHVVKPVVVEEPPPPEQVYDVGVAVYMEIQISARSWEQARDYVDDDRSYVMHALDEIVGSGDVEYSIQNVEPADVG